MLKSKMLLKYTSNSNGVMKQKHLYSSEAVGINTNYLKEICQGISLWLVNIFQLKD